MPSFFAFQQGSDSRSLPPPETESLRYGRFRAMPAPKRSVGNLFGAFSAGASRPLLNNGRLEHYSYGAINTPPGANNNGTAGGEEVDKRWWLDRVFISPRRKTVAWMAQRFWRRLGVLVVLPATIVSPPSSKNPRPCLDAWTNARRV